MADWIKPIYDRTRGDVSQAAGMTDKINRSGLGSLTAEERVLWDAGMKGAYNASDLNRVENNTQYVRDLLFLHGYVAHIVTKTNWVKEDYPYKTELERYLGNIKMLIRRYTLFPSSPRPPETMDNLMYTGANAIERILYDITQIIPLMTSYKLYCGEICLGEEW
jgi:hypothetical protein